MRTPNRDVLQWHILRNMLKDLGQQPQNCIVRQIDDPLIPAKELHQTLPDPLYFENEFRFELCTDPVLRLQTHIALTRAHSATIR